MISDFYSANADFINGVAATITIITFLFGISRFLKAQQQRVSYQWTRRTLLENEPPFGYQTEVKFKGKSGGNLVLDTILISNRTKLTLTDEDFVEPISFNVHDGKTVFQTRVVKDDGGSFCDIESDEDRITLKNIRIPREKTLKLVFSHDAAIEKELFVTTKSIPDFRATKFRKPEDRSIGKMIIGCASIGMFFLIILGFQLLGHFFEQWKISQLWLIPFALPALIIVVIVPEYFSRLINFTLRPLLGISSDEYSITSDQSHRFGLNALSKINSEEKNPDLTEFMH